MPIKTYPITEDRNDKGLFYNFEAVYTSDVYSSIPKIGDSLTTTPTNSVVLDVKVKRDGQHYIASITAKDLDRVTIMVDSKGKAYMKSFYVTTSELSSLNYTFASDASSWTGVASIVIQSELKPIGTDSYIVTIKAGETGYNMGGIG